MRAKRQRWPKLAPACLILTTATLAAGRLPSQLPSGGLAFVVDLDTTGGFSGRGIGGVTVDSSGGVLASRRGGVSREKPDCRAKLPADQLESLQRAVAAVSQPWPQSFAPTGDDGCCDRFRWTLRLEQRPSAGDRPRTLTTQWYDGNEARLPPDVKAIKDVAVRALTACGRP